MTWYAVYQTADGELVSTTTEEPTALGPGLTYKSVGETRPEGIWNTSTLVFDPPPPIRILTVREFLDRFTGPEAVDCFGTDIASVTNTTRFERINGFRWYLNAIDDLDLDHNFTSAGMQAFVDEGWLTSARRDAILADG